MKDSFWEKCSRAALAPRDHPKRRPAAELGAACGKFRSSARSRPLPTPDGRERETPFDSGRMLLVAKRALLSRAAALVLTGAAVLCAIALVSTARGALASDSALNGDDDAAGDGDAPPSALKAGLFTCAAGATADDALGIDYACNDLRYASPSTYLHSYAAGGADPQYDLLIVGAGVQAAYLVDNLRDALGKVAFNKLRIGIFEAERMTGGRLMSAWGGGDLSYTSQLRSPGDTVPMEYGGMRIDPKTHFLAFDALRKTAKWHDPDAKCERNNDVNPGTILKADGSDQAGVSVLMDALKALYGGEGVYTGLGQTADCPGYLTHMNTAVMRYFTNGSKAEFGDYLRSSTLFDDGSVEAGCLDLIGHTNTLFEANREKMLNESKSFVELVNNACTFACKQTDTYADFCTLCAKFPPGRQGQNLVSCIGYDDLPGVSPAVGIDEAAAVTGRGDYSCTPATSPGCSYLYLFNHGMQTFAQELLAGKPNTGFNPVGVVRANPALFTAHARARACAPRHLPSRHGRPVISARSDERACGVAPACATCAMRPADLREAPEGCQVRRRRRQTARRRPHRQAQGQGVGLARCAHGRPSCAQDAHAGL